ncbi:MAG TPA: cupin domain-containing protein [Edaphobacter sp.]|jgi:quercetin dioxygenase-like cupin family protein
MAGFDSWAYVFALILYAPIHVEAAVITQPPHEAVPEQAQTARSKNVISQPLPKLNGDRLIVHVVEVRYGPGEHSQPHTHPCPVIGYVLEGAVKMQVKGGAEKIYHAGDSFYEAPNGVHLLSANASQTAPAHFLATFVCDHPAPLTSPVPASEAGK